MCLSRWPRAWVNFIVIGIFDRSSLMGWTRLLYRTWFINLRAVALAWSRDVMLSQPISRDAEAICHLKVLAYFSQTHTDAVHTCQFRSICICYHSRAHVTSDYHVARPCAFEGKSRHTKGCRETRVVLVLLRWTSDSREAAE